MLALKEKHLIQGKCYQRGKYDEKISAYRKTRNLATIWGIYKVQFYSKRQTMAVYKTVMFNIKLQSKKYVGTDCISINYKTKKNLSICFFTV